MTLGAVGFIGCGGPNAKLSPVEAGVFRYAINNAPTTLDPAKVQDIDTIDLLSNVYEGLVAYDEQNHIVGQLASKWVAEQGGKVWTFTLRPDAKFQNGRRVVAEDVKWSLERACSKALTSPTASNYLRDIEGASDELDGSATGIKGITVVDPQHIRFTLDRPRAYFLGKLTYPCAFVLAKEAAGAGEIDDLKASAGTGPFKISRYDHEQRVELEANPTYYLGAPKLRKIQRPIVKDSSTRLNLFRIGQLDTLGIDRKDIKFILDDATLKSQLTYQPRPAINYLGVSGVSYPPFKDRRVRRAVAMAIDRDRIGSVLLDGAPIARGMLPPGVPGYRENYAGLPFNPDAARIELADAGFPAGKGLPPLTLVYRSQSPDAQHVCEGVAASLRQNLGMDVQLTTLEIGAFLEARNKGKLSFYFLSWYADYLDAQNFLSFLLTTNSPMNHDGYSNPEFDRLCVAADTTVDETTRLKEYQSAEDVLIQDAGRIPLYFQRDAVLVSPKVKGLRNNLFGQMPNLHVTVEAK